MSLADSTNVGPDLGLPIGGKERRAVAWGDYDGDGYLDLYIGSNRQGNELFHNDRSQGFTEVTAEFQVGVPKVSTRQISWIDYDNNGTLDLFVADRVEPTCYSATTQANLSKSAQNWELMTREPQLALAGLTIIRMVCSIYF